MSIETLIYANVPTFRHRKQRFKQKKQIYHKKTFYKTSNPQPIGFRGILLVKRQKFFYCTYSLGITETS